VADPRLDESGSVEVLLAQTRRQVTRFILVATAFVIGAVVIVGAIAGSRALDAGIDSALFDRATRISGAIYEAMQPPASGSPRASETPEASSDLDEGPSASPSVPPTIGPRPSSSNEPSGAPESETPDPTDTPESSQHGRVSTGRDARFLEPRPATVLPGMPRNRVHRDAAPLIPPGLGDEELGAGGPWAVLASDGRILAISAGNYQAGHDGAPSLFPVLTSVAGAATGPVIETVVIGRADYRILTLPLRDPAKAGGPLIGYVQVASRLDVRDAQRQNLIGSLGLVALLALGGALVVALLITRRALAPIAAAAARERAMVASASHELRTPAAVILSSAEILEREKLVKPAGMDLVRGIVAESERLGRLSADLLSISTKAASKEASASVAEAVTGVELRPIDLADVVRAAVERAAPMAQRSGAGLHQQIGTTPLPINGDAGRLMQLLLGLVENALRHSPSGGTVTIGTGLEDGAATAWVDDEGTGIAVADRERIFEPFYRGAGTTRTDGGAGLGLAIARQIVLAHAGTITAATAPSGGARLVVRLPLHDASGNTPPSASGGTPRRSQGRA